MYAIRANVMTAFLASTLLLFSCTASKNTKSALSNNGTANTPTNAKAEASASTLPQAFTKFFDFVSGEAHPFELELRRNGNELSGFRVTKEKAPVKHRIKGKIDEQKNFHLTVLDAIGDSWAQIEGHFITVNRIEGKIDGYDFVLKEEQALRPLTLDQQANIEAHNFWETKVYQCEGNSYAKSGNFVYQFRFLEIKLKPWELSNADRLNGIEWQGTTYLETEASRVYSPITTVHYDPGWNEWVEGFPGLSPRARMTKVNGKWSVEPDEWTMNNELRPLRCSDVPKR